MICPNCKSSDLWVNGEQTIKAYLDGDGSVYDSTPETGIEWDEESDAGCTECNWNGQVKNLIPDEE